MFSNSRDVLREKMARCNINKYAKRRLPILSWLTTYQLSWLPQDALAGFTVGLTAIPQGIAYGVVAGLSPEYGLYASFMASFVYIVFGSCKSITIGPTAIMATMVQPLVLNYGPDMAVLLTFLKGCIIALLGLLHLVVVVGTVLAYIFFVNEQTPFVLTGTLGKGLPPIGPPPFSITANNRTYDFIETTAAMGTTLFFVPVVSAIEHMAIAKAFAMGKSLDATQEMFALGLCNMFGSFVRSMPVTGSFTRTAVNHSSGVKTTFGGLFTGCLVLLASSLLTSTFRFIPKATLAAVIICAMYYMLDFKTYALLWRARKVDFFLMSITFLFCVFLKLEWGILIGIILNLVILLYFSTRFTVQTKIEQVEDKIVIRVTPEETVAFPAAEDFRARIMKLSENNSSSVVLDCKNLKRIDVTVAKNLKLLANDLRLRGRAINCVNCRDNVAVVLKAIAPDTQSGPSDDQNLYP